MDDQSPDWAICCSGGGIRSATYCLGALQSLRRDGLYRRARWIVGVSGGSYIAASLALVRHDLAFGPDDPAYERGSAEEQHLRSNLRWIAPDAKTLLVGVISAVLGAAITACLVLSPVYALSHVLGWLLRAHGVLTWTRTGVSVSVTAWSWWLAPVIAAGITLILSAFSLFTLPGRGADRGAERARWTGWAAALTAALALALLAVPVVISWLDHSTGPVAAITHAVSFGTTGHLSVRKISGVAGALSSLIAALVAVAGWCRTQLARVKAAETQATSAAPGVVTSVARWAVSHLTPWLASAVVVAIGMAAALAWTAGAARTGYTPGQLVPVAAALAIALSARVGADFNQLSLHDLYRWRLSTVYAVTRAACRAPDADRARLFARAAGTRLSELRGDDGPELVICTTAKRGVRPGQGGFCLAFDPEHTTLRGRPGSVDECVTASTADYEHLVGHSRLTLFDLVTISGAAVSPLMGSATKVAYRILLTATNLRLGMWLPHPALVRNARAHLDGEYDAAGRGDPAWSRRPWALLAWYVLPHPRWHADRARSERFEARLWAHLLEARENATAGRGTRRARFGAAVCWRVMQPTMGLLRAEAAGHTCYRSTWINVTDGGHYDNLGLVEALRRKPARVLVLDASGDHADTWATLGSSMALARMDAGVEISLDPTAMTDGQGPLAPGQVHQPWAAGSFRSVTGTLGRSQPGELCVCKLGWWKGAPWDVAAYARGHPSYPCQPTLQQLSTSSEFEAYHELGASTVELAGRQGALPTEPPAQPVPDGRTQEDVGLSV